MKLPLGISSLELGCAWPHLFFGTPHLFVFSLQELGTFTALVRTVQKVLPLTAGPKKHKAPKGCQQDLELRPHNTSYQPSS